MNLASPSPGEGTLVSDTPSDFESGDGVLSVGEVGCGTCTSASGDGGAGGARVGIGGVDSGSAMVRRILQVSLLRIGALVKSISD